MIERALHVVADSFIACRDRFMHDPKERAEALKAGGTQTSVQPAERQYQQPPPSTSRRAPVPTAVSEHPVVRPLVSRREECLWDVCWR